MARRVGRRKARNRCIRELRKWLTMERLGRVGEVVGFPDERLIAGESAWGNDIRLRRTISPPGAWTISEPVAQTISASRTGRGGNFKTLGVLLIYDLDLRLTKYGIFRGWGERFPDDGLNAGESAWENDIRLRRTISTPGAWTISEPAAQTISAPRTGGRDTPTG